MSSRRESAVQAAHGQGAQQGGKAQWHGTEALITCRRKLLLGQCYQNSCKQKPHTSQHLQLKNAQNMCWAEICWAKKKLCTPVCWSSPLQEGSNELKGSGWRGNSFSSLSTATLEWHTEVSWMWQAVGTKHVLPCYHELLFLPLSWSLFKRTVIWK